jgi:hypothetical protein
LVHKLDVQQNLPPDGVISFPYLPEVKQGINGGKEGAIEPSSSL